MLRGKLPAKPVAAAARFGAIWSGGMPPIPTETRWSTGLTRRPVFLNDTLPCCTWAAQANRIRVWAQINWGEEYILPDDVIKAGFLEMSGGDTTSGLFTTDVLRRFSSKLLMFPGREYGDIIHSWVAADHRNPHHRRAVVAFLVGGSVGMRLPRVVDDLFALGKVWDVPSGQALTGIWEPADGHEIWLTGQNAAGLWAISWGQEVFMTNAWVDAYIDELYGMVSPLAFDVGGLTPAHLDRPYIDACMAQVRLA